MKINHLLAFISILCVVTQAIAQATGPTTKPSRKTQNKSALGATSFMGIALDHPFPGEMPPCPKNMKIPSMIDFNATEELGVQCHHKTDPDKFEVHNGPNLGATIKVLTFEEKPLFFQLSFFRKQFTDLADIFVSKYGPAHASKSETLWSGEGKPYLARELQWEGARIRIKLIETSQKDVRWGEAIIQNVELANIKDAQRKKSISEAAEKL